MLNVDSSKPYYEQIKAYILYRINSGDLAPHARIPSERTLSEQFGVSRLTVSKAIKELVIEGRLYTQVGKGTFVNDAPIDQTLDRLTSFSEEMAQRGQQPTSQVIDADVRPASERVARRLDIPVGVPVARLKRVRMANGGPVALETAHLIADACPGITTRFDFERESLYAVLRAHYDVRFVYADQELEARPATDEEAQRLGLARCEPILSIARVTYIEGGRPLEYVESAYRGDRYKFRARLMQR